MLSPLRNRFGIPGVISVIALVFAMMGGAYAATNEGGSSSATASAKKKNKKKKNKGVTVSQVRKISKQEARKFANSNPGAPGALGPQGPAGLPGANGNDGQNGQNGSDGDDGATGATGPEGPEGEPGEPGEPGPEGSPWTVGGTLPSGETLTGAWAFSGVQTAEVLVKVSVSFPIPLAAPISGANSHVAPHANCPGSVEDPQADAGHFCSYPGPVTNATPAPGGVLAPIHPPHSGGMSGAGTSGAVLQYMVSANNANGSGTFAVTAP